MLSLKAQSAIVVLGQQAIRVHARAGGRITDDDAIVGPTGRPTNVLRPVSITRGQVPLTRHHKAGARGSSSDSDNGTPDGNWCGRRVARLCHLASESTMSVHSDGARQGACSDLTRTLSRNSSDLLVPVLSGCSCERASSDVGAHSAFRVHLWR